jgi:hypothetical protein
VPARPSPRRIAKAAVEALELGPPIEEARRRLWRARGKQIVHLLHIGKTGGTAVQTALTPSLVAPRHVVRLHNHGFRLADVPETDACFFFLRDPVSRFVSGFNSRLRQGKPRHDTPWSAAERRAFERYPTPDALATALGTTDLAQLAEAAQAMGAIGHLRTSFADWLGDEEALRARRESILLVGRQETLDTDFARLTDLVGLPRCTLPRDDVGAHRTPAGMSTTLSDDAIENLRAWYRRDYELLDFCERELR